MTDGRYERLWERLLEFLSSWASAAEIGPGRIQVAFEDPAGHTRVVTVVITRDEWDEMVSVPYGRFEPAADEVRKAILTLPTGYPYLVYSKQYDLWPSPSEVPLPDEDEVPLPGGRWYAGPPGVERGRRDE